MDVKEEQAQAAEQPAAVEELPVLTVRDTVIFPGALLPITVGRPASVALVQSLGENRRLAVVSQLDPREDTPGPQDLYQVGTTCVMHKAIRVPKENLLLFCEGIERIRTQDFVATEPFLRARVERVAEIEPEDTPELEALRQTVTGAFQQIVSASPNLSDDLSSTAAQIIEAGKLADFVAGNVPSLSPLERQKLLEERDGRVRLNEIHRHLTRELELIELRGRIQSQVQGQLSQSQREFYLREQLKAIQKELGEGDESARDTEDLRKKLDAAGMPEEVKTEAFRELQRLSRISPASPEYGVTRTYLEWMANLPWSVSSGSQVDVKRAAEILDEDHYDLEKVKDRILDYLAVLQLRPVLKGPILCFVGPPGVGKTSLGRSIARALGRKFARISMGGMHDEAEIRGHRRTYIGALPGQIVQALRRAGANDPVFMLDEVDKLGRDFRGDPASALLEVLDPEQNSTFRDNYLDVPFDLSKVLFITTANVLDPVPDALRDRMEIISLEGYTEQENDDRLPVPCAPADEGERAGSGKGHGVHRWRRAIHYPPIYARGRGSESGARDRHDLPQTGAANRGGNARADSRLGGTSGEGPRRAALPHGHGSGREDAPGGCGRWPGVDAGWR
jgi:ATP-dependent Lon protease